MAKIKEYFDSIWYSSLQAKMAVCSFAAGVTIACVCIFCIEPLGEISSTAISVVSELLLLAGGLLGVKASFDYKQQKFAADVADALAKKEDKKDTAENND